MHVHYSGLINNEVNGRTVGILGGVCYIVDVKFLVGQTAKIWAICHAHISGTPCFSVLQMTKSWAVPGNKADGSTHL